MCCDALRRTASPATARSAPASRTGSRSGSSGSASARSTSIPPSASIRSLKSAKLTTTTWLIGEAGEVVHRLDRERGAADLERGVDLLRRRAGDRHDDVARDREVVEAVVRRVGAQEHDRVGVAVAGAAADLRVVGAEQQDGRRVREQQAALLCRAPPSRSGRGACSRRRRRSRTRTSSRRPRRRSARRAGASAEADAPAPARPASAAPPPGAAVVGARRFPPRCRRCRPTCAGRSAGRAIGRRGNLSLGTAAAVDAVRLLFPRHPAGYVTHRVMSANRVIGVDLGGTKILAGVDRRDGTVHADGRAPDADDLAGGAPRRARRPSCASCRRTAIDAVGFGIPSRIDHARRHRARRGEHPAARRPVRD